MDKILNALEAYFSTIDEKINKFYNHAGLDGEIEFMSLQSKDIDISFKRYLYKYINRFNTIKSLYYYIKDVNILLLLEAGIYEYAIRYCSLNNYAPMLGPSIYDDKFKQLIDNFDKETSSYNADLLKKIKNKKINVQYVPFMNPQDLDKKNWEIILRKTELMEFKKENMAATDRYTCRKCGERRSFVYEKQTRSADEPMTTFIECLECGHTMKK